VLTGFMLLVIVSANDFSLVNAYVESTAVLDGFTSSPRFSIAELSYYIGAI